MSGSGAMSSQPRHPHQPLRPLAADPVTHLPNVNQHLAAAVERMPRVFGVDQGQQRQFLGVWFRRLAGRVGRGSGDARQSALAGQRQRPARADPTLAVV